MCEIIVICSFCGATLALPATKGFVKCRCPECNAIFDFFPTQNSANVPSRDFGLSKLEKEIKSLNTTEKKIDKNTLSKKLKELEEKNIKNKKAVK